MLVIAQDRAKDLIENYITQLGDISKTNYQIKWSYQE